MLNADGTLTYSFVESLTASYPFYFIRFIGGTLVVAGFALMIFNMLKTIYAEDNSLKKVEVV